MPETQPENLIGSEADDVQSGPDHQQQMNLRKTVALLVFKRLSTMSLREEPRARGEGQNLKLSTPNQGGAHM